MIPGGVSDSQGLRGALGQAVDGGDPREGPGWQTGLLTLPPLACESSG